METLRDSAALQTGSQHCDEICHSLTSFQQHSVWSTHVHILVSYLDDFFQWQRPNINRLQPPDRPPGLMHDSEVGDALEF